MTKPIIGILGGGQLGMMLSDAAKRVGIKTHVYCPEDKCPASFSSDFFTKEDYNNKACLLYTSPSPRDKRQSRMPSSA